MNERQKLLLVDGMALLFRAFYATAPFGRYMVNEQGIATNGVQGFLRRLLIAVRGQQPTHVAVCWDLGEKTFRHRLYDGYKANRDAPPAEMIPQFDLAKNMTAALDIPNICVSGFEADDCIGTLAKRIQNLADVSIVTGDRDLLQLLDRHVTVLILRNGYGNYSGFTKELFVHRYGITPKQFIDVKALMGDASDGYPGVRGIGEKTAFRLIRRYGDLAGILNHLDELASGWKKKIAADRPMLALSRQLAEICCDVPLEWDMKRAAFQGIPATFAERAADYGLTLIRAELPRMQREVRPTGSAD
ncbi:MAG: 5'-3' exonuclease [Sporolactobacillus sp.]|nr:5'-3' exonuclease [Sporolactobacillus sp.]